MPNHWRLLAAAVALFIAAGLHSDAAPKSQTLKVEISFPAAAHQGAITGRVFLMLTPVKAAPAPGAAAAPEKAAPSTPAGQAGARNAPPEPRLRAEDGGDSAPIFGANVDALAPGQVAVIDGGTPGYPTPSLRNVPAGAYDVQALLNVYTEFHRADGRTVWLHMDQWEGQHFNRSPGNLYSEVQRVHLDPAAGW